MTDTDPFESGADLDTFASRRSTVYAPRGIVATSQPLAARAGLRALEDGGNAFDAAVTTAAALNVVEPTSTGLGGDVFVLYRTADGEVGALRSCGGAPAAATVDRVRDLVADEDSDDVSMPETGPHTVTVPGTARGWEATVERFGRRSLSAALEPAIEYASEGFPVTPVVAHQWEHADDLFTDDHARAAYLLDGRPPAPGETVRLPGLSDSLRTVAERGADAVYEGAIADAIVSEVRERGGLLSHGDLADFEPEFVDPVATTYAGAEVYELPPNNQGLIALEALNIGAELDAGSHPAGSGAAVHYWAEATKRAFHDGHRYITDPEFESVPPLGSTEWARRRAADVSATASDVTFGVPDAGAEDADTVLLTVADDEGNLVSYINSRFAGFGSGLVAGETGIALQNRGASFSLDPDHPNALAPGKRPFHTLVPAVARFGPDDWAAFGVMGGYMQPQGHVQVLTNLLDHGLSLQAALDAPRWRYLESGSLALEPRFDDGTASDLLRRGHDVVLRRPDSFGGAQIVRNDAGTLSGATEPRKDGIVTGY